VKHEQLSQADEIDWALNDPIDDDEVATSDRDGNYSASDLQWESDDESADSDESDGDAPPPQSTPRTRRRVLTRRRDPSPPRSSSPASLRGDSPVIASVAIINETPAARIRGPDEVTIIQEIPTARTRRRVLTRRRDPSPPSSSSPASRRGDSPVIASVALSQADEIDWALNGPLDDDEVANSDRDGSYSASDSQWESEDECAHSDESEGDAPPPQSPPRKRRRILTRRRGPTPPGSSSAIRSRDDSPVVASPTVIQEIPTARTRRRVLTRRKDPSPPRSPSPAGLRYDNLIIINETPTAPITDPEEVTIIQEIPTARTRRRVLTRRRDPSPPRSPSPAGLRYDNPIIINETPTAPITGPEEVATETSQIRRGKFRIGGIYFARRGGRTTRASRRVTSDEDHAVVSSAPSIHGPSAAGTTSHEDLSDSSETQTINMATGPPPLAPGFGRRGGGATRGSRSASAQEDSADVQFVPSINQRSARRTVRFQEPVTENSDQEQITTARRTLPPLAPGLGRRGGGPAPAQPGARPQNSGEVIPDVSSRPVPGGRTNAPRSRGVARRGRSRSALWDN
jgi:hypothetical protein